MLRVPGVQHPASSQAGVQPLPPGKCLEQESLWDVLDLKTFSSKLSFSFISHLKFLPNILS